MIAERTLVTAGAAQKRRVLPEAAQSASDVQPTGAQTPSGPHTVPLKGCPEMSPDGLQSWSTVQGIPQTPLLHAARALPSREKHSASFEQGVGTQSFFVASHE